MIDFTLINYKISILICFSHINFRQNAANICDGDDKSKDLTIFASV